MNGTSTALLLFLAVHPVQTAAPADFAFRFQVTRCDVTTVMDTFQGVFIRDTPRALPTPLSAPAVIPAESMQAIYEALLEARFFEYPSEFVENTATLITHSPDYRVHVRSGGVSHTVAWRDDAGAASSEAVRLRTLFRRMSDIIFASSDVMKFFAPLGLIPC